METRRTPIHLTLIPNRSEALPREEGAGCLHDIFEMQVDNNPLAIAVISDEVTLTYRELDERANRLARLMRKAGAVPGKLIAIYFERSELPIISILACLKAGAAYVPIDPGYPEDRIRHILEETEAPLVVTETALVDKARAFFSGNVLVVDEAAALIDRQSPARLTRADSGVAPSDLAYIIYTSGTTGRPKGVMAEHRHVYRFVAAFNDACRTTGEDRIFQGFSLSFDGSVEEIWMAFSNGASLVVPSRHAPRFGNDLAAYLAKHRVTYFSTVPTMLSTMTDDVPSLRQLVVSGEICPPELVARWAKPRRLMLNVYGPTEATVNTTAAVCLPDRPITIGRPLDGYGIHILDETMRPVTPGAKGELFVAGETLARGYFKQAELTAEKFIELRGRRLYRTGDLVRLNESGELEFFGRIDGQVKIRGFRVELAEIESVLLEWSGIRSASVKLASRGEIKALAAYVVSEGGAALDRDALLDHLERRLPDYMVPSTLDELVELPMLTSGKADRGRMPEPKSPLVRAKRKIVAASTALEETTAKVWAKIFGTEEISVLDDFFSDLGGHSLLAAQMVTRLRQATGRDVAVRDAYRYTTIRALAAELSGREATATSEFASARRVYERQAKITRVTTAGLQALSIVMLFALGTTPVLTLFLLALGWLNGDLTGATALGYGTALALGIWPFNILLAIAAKWSLIGRFKAGEHPLWGFYHFRFWLAGRLQALAVPGALAGTPLLPVYLRAMGARVGSHALLDSAGGAAWDLLDIGDETSIGADSQFTGYRVENGMLRFGRITIGRRCFVGIHSALGLNARMENESALDDQSYLPDGVTIAAGERRRGSPAIVAEVSLPEIGPTARPRPVLFGIVQFLLAEILGITLLLPGLPIIAANFAAYWYGGALVGTATLVASVPVGFVFYALFIAGLKRVILWRARPGVYALWSFAYLRKWLSDELMKVSRRVLMPLYTTMYFPSWLRLMGAKIGRRAELSTVWAFSPELVDVGDESFFADGSIIGGKRIHGGRFEIGINRIGRRSFVGNSAILPTGGSLGDGCLLGVLSAAPAREVASGTDWLGSPAFALPNRHKVGGFSLAETFQPTRKLYLQRAIVDACRILIPGYLGLGGMVAFLGASYWLLSRFGVGATLTAAPIVALGLGVVACAAVVALKRAVMGTFHPVVKPLWSMYVWLNEMVNGAYESVMSPFLVPFLGTPFVAPFLRALGCKIGRRTYIETTLFSEFDLVEVGDYVALNAGAIIQNHLFEDRVMKSSSLKIGDECTVGNMAVVLYDSEMAPGTNLAPLSLLMKGETLTGGRWVGIPCSRA